MIRELRIGAVEKFLYDLREDGPVVIPQIDPEDFSQEAEEKLLTELRKEGVRLISTGGTLVDPIRLNQSIQLAVKDYDMRVITYPSESAALINGVKDRTAIYWMRILNAANPYFQTDFFVMNSLFVTKHNVEPIPSDYIFDDRGSTGTAAWLARAYPVPRDKPQIGLALAVGAQNSGTRVFVVAGGSGAKLPPSTQLLKLIREKTELFLVAKSGIDTVSKAEEVFAAGADAIHVGKLLEMPSGTEILKKMLKAARKNAK